MCRAIHLAARIAFAGAFVTVALAATAHAARAGAYTVHNCRKPDGSGAPTGEWRVTSHDAAVDKTSSGCPGSAFQLQMLADKLHDADDYIRANWVAPADTDIQEYSVWRSAQVDPAYNYRLYEITSNGTYVPMDVCLSTCTGLGGAQPLGSANLVRHGGRTGVKQLEFRLTCGLDDASTAKCPAIAPAARMWLHRADITLRDASAPVFASPPTGPLVSSPAPLVGMQSVSIAATDKGGGVYQAQLEVDGKIADTMTLDDNGGQCRPPYTMSVPCKLSASATVPFDTTRFADGAHTLRILITDAGTNVAAWGPGTFQTANKPCNPEPAVDALTLQAGILSGRGKRRHLRGAVKTGYGRPVQAQGRLTTPHGAPVPGAEVCVASRTDLAAASLHMGGSVVTDANGAFSYAVPPGPSRRIYFIHRTSSGAVTGSVLQRVRASSSLHVSDRSLRTGQAIVFSGRLRGRPIPQRGVLVEIQALRPTGWSTFGRTVRADRRGRFHLRYLFSRTRGLQRYVFRARVPRQATYPYLTGKSNRVRVRVRG